jgi:translation initiation factor IF-3
MQHPELGRRILDRVAEEVAEVGKVEVMPKQDGRNMTMVLGPDKKAQEKARKDAAAAAPEPEVAPEQETVPDAAEVTEPAPVGDPT